MRKIELTRNTFYLSLINAFGELLTQIWICLSKISYFIGGINEIMNYFINKGYNNRWFTIGR